MLAGNDQLDHSGLPLLQHRQQARPAAIDPVNHGRHGGALRRQGHVDAHPLEKTEVRRLPHSGDHLAHAKLATDQTGQKIPLVVVDDGHQDIASSDLLCFEELQVCPIAVENERVLERRGQQLPARAVRFDHAETNTRSLVETLGQPVADVASPDDGHELGGWGLEVRQDPPTHIVHPLGHAHEHDLVSGREFRRPAGYGDRVVVLDGHDHHTWWEVERGDRLIHQGRPRI